MISLATANKYPDGRNLLFARFVAQVARVWSHNEYCTDEYVEAENEDGFKYEEVTVDDASISSGESIHV